MQRNQSSSGMGLRIVLLIGIVLLTAGTLFAQKNGILDATRSHAVVPHAPALNPGSAMTLEAWIRPSPQTQAFQAIIDKDYDTGFSLGIASAYPRTDSNMATLYLGGIHCDGPLVVTDSSTWTHIAVTVDTVTRSGRYYLNGVPSRTFSGGLVRLPTNTRDLKIGTSQHTDDFFGLIDEVRIWNVIRSDAEIAALWNHEARGNEPGLVAVYHFEDPRDTVVWNRAVGGGLTGSLAPGAAIVQVPWTIAFTDEHEVNNSPAKATPLAYEAVISNASIATADTDYYKIYTRPGDVFRVTTAAKTPGDTRKLRLSVYGPDSVLHITTYTSGVTGFPALYSAASAPGYRYVRVVDDGGTPGPYTITAHLTQTISPDSTEPNNSRATATPVSWGKWKKGTIFPGIDGRIATPDTDYYSIEATTGDIGVFIYSLQGFSCGSAFCSVLDQSGAAVTSTYPNYAVNRLFTAGGTYYTRVRPNEAACEYVVGWFKGLLDVNGMLYDPLTYSSNVCLMDGYSGAYDQAYDLKINGSKFNASADYSQSAPGGRQLVFGPAAMSGLTVWRKFFVPTAAQGDTLGYCRIQEILTNPTGSPITVTVGVLSNFGSDLSTRTLASSSGDTLATTTDRWLVTDDQLSPGGDPTLTTIIDGVGGTDRIDSLTLSADNLYWEWRSVTIPAGETRIYLYFVAQDTVPSKALKKGPLFAGSTLPTGAKLGVGSDAARVMNWPTSALVSADEAEPLPAVFVLEQNYPNPFNGISEIGFAIADCANVRLRVFDLLGRAVATLVNERKTPGKYAVRWDAGRLASGVYFYRLEAKSEGTTFVDVKKMVLMK